MLAECPQIKRNMWEAAPFISIFDTINILKRYSTFSLQQRCPRLNTTRGSVYTILYRREFSRQSDSKKKKSYPLSGRRCTSNIHYSLWCAAIKYIGYTSIAMEVYSVTALKLMGSFFSSWHTHSRESSVGNNRVPLGKLTELATTELVYWTYNTADRWLLLCGPAVVKLGSCTNLDSLEKTNYTIHTTRYTMYTTLCSKFPINLFFSTRLQGP